MAMIQADFSMCTRLMHFHDRKAKKAFAYKKAKGKVKDLPAVIFHLIPLFPTSLCKALLDKPIITMPVFAYVYICIYAQSIYWSPEALLLVYHQIAAFERMNWCANWNLLPIPKTSLTVWTVKRARGDGAWMHLIVGESGKLPSVTFLPNEVLCIQKLLFTF